MKVFAVVILIFALIPQASTANSYNQNKQSQLKRLRAEIVSIEKELATSKNKKQDLQKQLRLLDITIGKSNVYIKELGKQIKSYKQELSKLKNKKQILENTLATQQHELAQQIRNSYIMGRQNFLKMLLNQQQPATLTRTLTYYDYINRAKTKQIDRIGLKVSAISNISQNIKQQTQALETNLNLQINEQKANELDYKNRQNLIDLLNTQIRHKTRKRKIIDQNIANLIDVLENLARTKQHIALPQSKPVKFAKLKGRLGWPVKGKLVTRYGSSRHIGSLKWQGIIIAAPKGKEIHAVSDGEVVFADWLRGFGLLMIIDHYDGYMSLYGQNDSLLKSEGTTVRRNEIIANVGRSGGIDQNGLYFEIRHKGKPTNPLNWLSRTK